MRPWRILTLPQGEGSAFVVAAVRHRHGARRRGATSRRARPARNETTPSAILLGARIRSVPAGPLPAGSPIPCLPDSPACDRFGPLMDPPRTGAAGCRHRAQDHIHHRLHAHGHAGQAGQRRLSDRRDHVLPQLLRAAAAAALDRRARTLSGGPPDQPAASAFLPLARRRRRHVHRLHGAVPAADRRRHGNRLCRAADDRGARRHLPRREGARLSLVGGCGRLHRRAGDPLRLCRSGAHRGWPRQAALGAVIAVGGAFLGAAATTQVRAMVRTEAASTIVFYFSLFSALAGLGSIPFTPWSMPGPLDAAMLVGAGIFGGIGQMTMTQSFRHADASLIAPFDYTSMIWALIVSLLVFNTWPSGIMLLGTAIVIAAGLFVIYREHRLGIERSRAKRRRRRPRSYRAEPIRPFGSTPTRAGAHLRPTPRRAVRGCAGRGRRSLEWRSGR